MEETVKSIPVAIDSITELEELKGFLPPIDAIADEKLRLLIENAKAVRDPLVLAKYEGQTIILDGHNRYRIAKSLEYTEVPAVYQPIDDLTDAKQFMIDNQLGKRNLSTKERILMVLQLEPELIAQAKVRKQMTKEEKEQNSAPSESGRTIVKLAAMAQTSRETIKQVKTIIATRNDKLISVADTKGFSINRAFEIAEKIKELPPEEQQALVDAELTKGKPDTDNEKIKIGEIEYTKISDFSYIYKYDGKFKVVGIATVKDKTKVISSVRVEFNQGIIELLPPYLQSWRTNLLFGVRCNDDQYDRVIREMNTFTDNIKMARKYADPELTTERNKVYATNPEFRPMTDKHKQLTEEQKQKAQTIATNIVNQIKSIDDINIKEMVKTLSHIIQHDAALVKILGKDTFNDVKFAKRLKAIIENHLIYKHEMKSVLDIMTAIINRPTPSQIKKLQEQRERKAKRAADKKVRDAERLAEQKAYRQSLSNTQENYFKNTAYALVAEPDKTTRKDDIDAIMEDVRLEIEVKNTKVADVRKALTAKYEIHGINMVNTKKKKAMPTPTHAPAEAEAPEPQAVATKKKSTTKAKPDKAAKTKTKTTKEATSAKATEASKQTGKKP